MPKEILYENGNPITGNYDIFCCQVNCKGVSETILAKQIKEKYPEVYEKYVNSCSRGALNLGTILVVETSDSRKCICMFAQDKYGRGAKTDYGAFKACLYNIKYVMNTLDKDLTIAFPYKIGCGKAGGDWEIIHDLIKNFARKIEQPVIIVNTER